jgi:hypothetical protein
MLFDATGARHLDNINIVVEPSQQQSGVTLAALGRTHVRYGETSAVDTDRIVDRRKAGTIEPPFDVVRLANTDLPSGVWVTVTVAADRTLDYSVAIDLNNAGEALLSLVRQHCQAVGERKLAEALIGCRVALIISTTLVNPQGLQPNPQLRAALAGIVADVADEQLPQAVADAHTYRHWTIPFEELALTIVPCDPLAGMNTEQLLEEKLKTHYERVEHTRRIVDTDRDRWLQQDAEPLLDELSDLIGNATLPAGFRERCAEVREQLRRDAYFPAIVQTSDAARQLSVDPSWVREMARQGRIGLKLSRHFIHSSKELQHFDEQPRDVGAPPGKRSSQ